MVEMILKNNHIFNNIVLTSKPRVIKVLPKSDMTIVSRMKSVNLVFSYFLSYFLFFSIYFHIFVFIELRVRVSHVTQEEKHRRF